jgi:hypothetical protein
MQCPNVASRRATLVVLAAACLTWSASSRKGAAAEPLHQRIDRLIEADQVSPPAGVCSDAQFVRRAWLDFAGRSPSAADVRAFLADASPDKRATLVDRLLASPEFARRLTDLLDVILMERRPDKHVPSAEWRKYLFESALANKPFDQLAREILSADSTDPKQRPAAKFLLDRDCDPNLVARDVGRVLFGMDLQCAQCHNHPLVDDYVQEHYYGIMAGIGRTFVFAAKDKPVELAERGEGDVTWKSVFDKSVNGQSGPRLPGDAPLAEPAIAKGDEYAVKPAENVRPVPKHSRRALFSAELAKGQNRALRRNLANRLWALAMGRGLVEPVDMHHSDNPPTHPELLDALADELANVKFDLRAMLREIALSRTYQRSAEMPSDLAERGTDAANKLAALEAEHKRLSELVDQGKPTIDKAQAELKTAQAAIDPIAKELAAVQAAEAEANKALDAANAAATAAQNDLAARQSAIQSLAEAAAKAAEAAAKLPADKELAAAAATIKTKSEQTAASVGEANKVLADRQTAAKALAEKQAAATQATAAVNARLAAASQPVGAAEQAIAALEAKERIDRLALVLATRRRDEAKLLAQARDQLAAVDAARAAGKPQAELDSARAAADATLVQLGETWTRRFAVGGLRPLVPEQLAWSFMQASGQVEQQRAAAEAEWTKAHPDAAKDSTPEGAAAKARFVEQFVFDKLQGNVGQFVTLFDATPGQPQGAFFATVDQALFLANGGTLRGWLNPGGGNLSERLLKLAEPAALADELYVSVLSRPPSPEEAAEVAAYLAARASDRPAAVQEIAWGLLASAEFRFNH